MIVVLLLLGLLWIAAGIIGLLFKGLFWLFIVALVLLIATVIGGVVHSSSKRR